MGSPQGTNRTIFVTVGTTLFEALIDGVTSASALQWMATNGYERLVIQYGKGRKPKLPDPPVVGLSIECYDYKPSLEADMQSADLIISRNTAKSHAVSIYRKLGATSRSEAVARATDLGLLHP